MGSRKIVRTNMEKEQEVYSPAKCFEPDRNLLEGFGFYPIWLENDDKYKGNKFFYYTRSFITLSISSIFFVFNWVHLFRNLENTTLVINTLYYALTQTNFILKLFNIYTRYDKFNELIAYLHSDGFNSYSKEQYRFISNIMWLIKWFRYAFRISIFLAFIFFSIFPFINDDLLPVPSYFPVDTVKYRPYLFVYQMIALPLDGYGQSSLDMMVCSLISIGAAQLDILMDNLVNLTKNLKNGVCDDAIVRRRLAVYVDHHVNIIRYLKKVDSLFSFVQFIQFICSSIIICATGFQILMDPDNRMRVVALILYFSGNMIEITMFCWFGHDVKTKSENIGNACYMSSWYNCSVSNCRTLFIIMERAKVPIVLTGGKFFEFSMQTLMQVLKTSYSYLALLDRLYS